MSTAQRQLRLAACLLLTAAGLVPAGRVSAIAWPIAAANAEHKVLTGYGHLAEATNNIPPNGFHFHEGADIQGADGTNVLSVARGTIEEKFTDTGGDNYGNYLTISVRGSVHTGWGYVHLRFGTNPLTGVAWTVGDTVTTGSVLGVVDAYDPGGIFSHVHLEYDSDKEGGGAWSPAGAVTAALLGDPMQALAPNGDTTAPTIRNTVYWRWANGEDVAAAKYFTDVVDTIAVVWDNVDLIAEGWDKFAGTTFNFDVPLAWQKMGFNIPSAGVFSTLEDFTGEFIAPPNSFDNFRDKELAQVIYEHDNTVQTNQDLLTGAGNKFFYILTNKDDDDILELTDRDRYWNTDIQIGAGNVWNTADIAAPSNEAKINEKALFSDGITRVEIFAEDDLYRYTSRTKQVILDNFKPYVKTVEIGNPVVYKADWTWDGTALQFQKSIDLPVPAGNHPIKIVFSEPVKSPTLNVSTFAAAIVLTSSDPTDQKVTWTGTLPLPAGDGSHNGQQTFTILAKDMANNDLDGDPPTIAARAAAGAWVDANDGTKKDEQHKPKLDATAPATVITVTQ